MTNQASRPFAGEIALDSNTDYHREVDAAAPDVNTGATVDVSVTGLRPRDAGSAMVRAVPIVP